MSRRATLAAGIAAFGLTVVYASGDASAQPAPAPSTAPAGGNSSTERRTQVQPEADTPADRFGFFHGDQLQVSAGAEDNNLTYRVALPVSPSMAHRFSLRVATPLNGDGNAMPASLDALANGTRATLSWGYFPRRINRETTATDEMVREARRKCREREPRNDQCDLSTYAMYRHNRDNWQRYLRLRGLGTWDFGIDATVGINDFEWLDAVALTPQKERHTDWSVAGHLARFFSGRQLVLTGSASYQRAFEAAEEGLICPAGASDPATQCRTGRGAAPTRDENLLLSAGLRYRSVNPDGSLGRLAVAPVLTFDFIDDVWGVDVPVYFVPGQNEALNGGIRFGYRSDRDDKFSISVFVGTTFDFFGGR